jgi:hypothetical protein
MDCSRLTYNSTATKLIHIPFFLYRTRLGFTVGLGKPQSHDHCLALSIQCTTRESSLKIMLVCILEGTLKTKPPAVLSWDM